MLIRSVGKAGKEIATPYHATIYRHVIGKLMFTGRMSSPLMLWHASMDASKLADLRCHNPRASATTLTGLQHELVEMHLLGPNNTSEKPFLVNVISDGVMATA